MSVTRWGWSVMVPTSLMGRRHEIEMGRHETKDGQFVLHADYAQLEAERDRLRDALIAAHKVMRWAREGGVKNDEPNWWQALDDAIEKAEALPPKGA